jgi:hypothetical protein
VEIEFVLFFFFFSLYIYIYIYIYFPEGLNASIDNSTNDVAVLYI